MCGYLEKCNMRAFCKKCDAMTIHVQSDEQKILCSICLTELKTDW